MTKPKNLGHRGASGYAPENTMAAFRLAMEMGSDGLEFDVQLTKDGVPVVIHDEQLIRTTGAPGIVWNYTWKEIQQLDAGSWLGSKWKGERIPSLEEVLSTFAGSFLNLELKNSVVTYDGLEEIVIELLDRYCKPSNVIVSSFNPLSVRKLMNIAPQIPVGFLFSKPSSSFLDTIFDSGATAVHPEFKTLTLETVADYRQKGFDVNTWTVNREEDMKEMVRIGVNGIITNYPDRLRKILNDK